MFIRTSSSGSHSTAACILDISCHHRENRKNWIHKYSRGQGTGHTHLSDAPVVLSQAVGKDNVLLSFPLESLKNSLRQKTSTVVPSKHPRALGIHNQNVGLVLTRTPPNHRFVKNEGWALTQKLATIWSWQITNGVQELL